MLTTVGNSPSVVPNQSSNEAVRISTLLAAIDARISRMQSAYFSWHLTHKKSNSGDCVYGCYHLVWSQPSFCPRMAWREYATKAYKM